MTMGLASGRGADCNDVKIGGVTRLYGDPSIKREKTHTIVSLPGGSVEISRTDANEYWVHVAVHAATPDDKPGQLVGIRLDAAGRYLDETNDLLNGEIAKGDCVHFAVRVKP